MSDGSSTRTGTEGDIRPRPGKPEVLIAPPTVLERGLCEAVANAKSTDPLRLVVVVAPSRVVAAAVPGVLARGLGAAVNVEVFTYDEFVRTLADARHGRHRADDLTAAQARVLARAVTARTKGWFEPLAGMPGFADAFCDFLADLRGARVSPEALTRAGLPIEVRRKLSSLATSAREFEDRRGRRRTHEDRVEDATVVIERTMGGVAVMLYGVTADTDADVRFLERVCHATTTTAFLPALRPPAAAAIAPTLEVLRHCGAEAVATPPEPEAADTPTALTHLQRHLFRLPSEAAPDDATVRLVSVPGPVEEAREAASACLASADAGIAFEDMAVVVPTDAPGYVDLVVTALGEAGIPWADLTPRRPAGTTAGREAAIRAARSEAGTWAERVDATIAGIDPDADGFATVEGALGELRVDDMCGPPDADVFAQAVAVTLSLPAEGGAARRRFDAARAGGGVSVVSAADAGLGPRESVVVLGLADGVAPRHQRVLPLLDDAERSRLNEALSADLPLAAAATRADPAAFALAVLSARARLTLVRPRAGLDGRYLSPSPYFRASAITLAGAVVATADIDAEERVAVETSPPDASLGRPGAGVPAWNARRSGHTYGAFEGIVESADLARLDPALPADGLSPTRLETYERCPFRFLVENVYRARRGAGDAYRYSIDPRDRGSLVHEVLERFLRDLGDDGPPAEARRDDQLALLDGIVDAVFESYEARVPPFPVVWDRTMASIRADLHRWWELEAAAAAGGDGHLWRPLMFEVPFGRAGDGADAGHPAVAFETGSGRVELSGRIDRVDVSADGSAYRVVDYKTGEPPRDGDAAGLQIPIYLRAAAAMTELPVEAGSGEYFHVTRRGGFARTRPAVDAGPGLDAAVSAMCESIAAGDFHPAPRTCRAWGGCEYPEVCGRRVADLVRSRAGDPRTIGNRP